MQQQDESERNMRKRKMQNGEGILPSKNVDEDEVSENEKDISSLSLSYSEYSIAI